jgi:hypothetical protein
MILYIYISPGPPPERLVCQAPPRWTALAIGCGPGLLEGGVGAKQAATAATRAATADTRAALAATRAATAATRAATAATRAALAATAAPAAISGAAGSDAGGACWRVASETNDVYIYVILYINYSIHKDAARMRVGPAGGWRRKRMIIYIIILYRCSADAGGACWRVASGRA